MNVMEYIREKRAGGVLHFTLIDPDRQSPEKSGELAAMAERLGSDGIMVGGSNPAHVLGLHEAVKCIKKSCKIPVILFPSSHSGVAPGADAIFFMSLFNSRSPQYIVEEQAKGAIMVRQYGIEPLPMAYLIVDSGSATSAGWTGDVKPIPREKPEFAVAYSLAAKYFGMRFVYLEGGSGAAHPVPDEMVKAVKHAVGDVFVIVGGGIRDPQTAREKVASGADIIVTGTIAENNTEVFGSIVRAVKGSQK
ncbi:MAG: geranylgeranylglyceryl/heptaprenylglyceryl phosphate synthase [Candidatus Aenigmarchaeota archaeon]|nr:geranylgeranylglyceryl/heptaprenylglyceryl phosphate synthase [Candidatus Aenigmarchaeota archaeon]